VGVARLQDFVTQLHSGAHSAIESASFADADRRLARSITPFRRGVSKKASFAFIASDAGAGSGLRKQ